MTLVLTGGTLAALPHVAEAQAPRAGDDFNRRQVVDDLIRDLVDSERLSNQLRNDYRSGQPYYDATRSPNPPAPLPAGSANMDQLRRTLADASQEADRFTGLLRDQMYQVPEIRPLIADALKLRARIAFLAQQAAQINDANQILPDLRGLDSDWRLLSYRLGQIRNLDPRIADSARRLNQYSQTVGSTFKISPQIDRSALIRLTAALAADLHNLSEDIDIELGGAPQRTALLLDGRRIEQQAQQMSYIIAERPDYNTVVAEYKRFQDAWATFAANLRTADSRYLERDIRRVVESDNQIRELLWLPQQQNPQQYLYLTQMLRKDVDEFFTRAPLKLLVDMPNPQTVLPTANAFYGYCDHLIDCVNRGESHEELIDAFKYIDSGWRQFNATFQSLQSSGARQVLSQIERDVEALRQAMNVRSGYDSQAVEQLAAQVDNLASHLDADVRMWLDRNRAAIRTDAIRQSSQVAAQAHQLHQSIINGEPNQNLQRTCDSLLADWRTLQQYIDQCNTADRAHMQSLAAQLTPAMVQLRTMLVPY